MLLFWICYAIVSVVVAFIGYGLIKFHSYKGNITIEEIALLLIVGALWPLPGSFILLLIVVKWFRKIDSDLRRRQGR